MNVARLVCPEKVRLQLKQARVQGSQGATAWAEHPAGKGCHRYAYGVTLIKRIGRTYLFWRCWRCEQPCHLRTKNCTYYLQKTFLTDHRRIRMFPVVQSHDDCRNIGQVYNGANAIREQHLALGQRTQALPF